MTHVRAVTVVQADAVSDFTNAVWRAGQDKNFEKGLTLLGAFNLSSLAEKG